MPLIKWNDSMSVGIPESDGEHRTLVEIINDLSDSKGDGCDDSFDGAMALLTKYADSHFSNEELMMTSDEVPFEHRAEHLRQHEFFRQRLALANNAAPSEGNKAKREIMAFLGSWLIKHIMSTDKKLSAFIAEKNGDANGM